MVTRSGLLASAATFFAIGMIVTAWESRARGESATTFRLGLTVPMICRVELHAGPPDAAAIAEEFCNAPGGYQIMALHPAAGGAVLWFDYDGWRIPASASGTTMLAEEPAAAHRSRSFAVYAPAGGIAATDVTLQIIPR